MANNGGDVAPAIPAWLRPHDISPNEWRRLERKKLHLMHAQNAYLYYLCDAAWALFMVWLGVPVWVTVAYWLCSTILMHVQSIPRKAYDDVFDDCELPRRPQ